MKFYQLIRSVINKIPGSQRLYNTLYNTSKKMQPQEHEVIQFLSPGDLFFDIGAHTGEKSKPFINKNFEVVMVEPQPKCIEELQRPLAEIKCFTTPCACSSGLSARIHWAISPSVYSLGVISSLTRVAHEGRSMLPLSSAAY